MANQRIQSHENLSKCSTVIGRSTPPRPENTRGRLVERKTALLINYQKERVVFSSTGYSKAYAKLSGKNVRLGNKTKMILES